MLDLHPQFLVKDGQKESVVPPYEELLAIQERLEDAEDLLELRKAKQEDAREPGMSLDDVRRRFRLQAE